jgi:hypothetical protein
MRSRSWRDRLVPALLLVAVALLVGLQSLSNGRSSDSRGPEPFPVPTGPAPAVTLGVTTPALARNAYRPWRQADLVQVNDFERRARQHAGIVMWFADWEHSRFDPRQAEAVARRGSIPEISWEPWDASVGAHRPQSRFTLASIIQGRHDAYVRRWAVAIKRYGRPLRLRFAQEMNGTWYPWAEASNGNRPGQYALAWRHVHAIFSATGATNVTWIWSPVAGTITRRHYPGASVVDVVAVCGFNGGTVLFGQGWRPFRVSFGPALDAVGRLAPGKPIEISEVASTEHGGDKAAWIRGMFAEIQRRPSIRSAIWFDVRKESDWRIASSARAQAAFAAGAQELRASGR